METDTVFICRKCEHHLFLDNEDLIGKLRKLSQYECPSCGEEGHRNWMFSHVGNFEEEKINYSVE